MKFSQDLYEEMLRDNKAFVKKLTDAFIKEFQEKDFCKALYKRVSELKHKKHNSCSKCNGAGIIDTGFYKRSCSCKLKE